MKNLGKYNQTLFDWFVRLIGDSVKLDDKIPSNSIYNIVNNDTKKNVQMYLLKKNIKQIFFLNTSGGLV